MAGRRLRPASPTAQSGTSTNPNTPRSPTLNVTERIDDRPAEANPSSEYTTSEEEHHDIQPTWPKSIEIIRAKAVVVWGDSCDLNVFLDIYWHLDSRKAFFKLRVPMALREDGSHYDARTVYIYIHPERIRRLSVDTDPAEKMLGPNTSLLSFEMHKPLALIVPKKPSEPKHKDAKEVMDACYEFASQISFAVYANIPCKKLSVKQIQELCAEATRGRLATWDVHTSTTSLYQGRGGQVIEGDTLTNPAHESSVIAEPPPHYSEPPSAELTLSDSGYYRGKKRRRVESSSPEPTQPPSLKTWEAFIQHIDDRFATQKKDIAELLDDRIANHMNDVAELLKKTEAQIVGILRKDINEWHNEGEESLLLRVQEGLAEVEDNVMRNLTEAPMTATVTFPNHPWY